MHFFCSVTFPVPYSGDIYPDTHSENHWGAWSADPYYAELNGHWTDEVVDLDTAFFDRNDNIPGDGKFDQDSIPSKVELQIGRVDLSRMPSFALDEIELTRRYLQKAHAYKTGQVQAERRALIDDNFGQAFAAPAASAWRNFAPMFGANQIEELDYFETLRQQSYLWSYGCGPGSHISAAGIGTTQNFAQDSLLSIFTMLFGSQFGDWDNPDNFLRAPLASGTTLSNCWAGSPPWTFHHMAIGYPIGYSTFRSMNSNKGVYLNGPQLVHMALMGDPSLRMFMIPPLADNSLQLQDGSQEVQLSWEASTASEVAGYLVYRSDTLYGDFIRISPDIVADTFFTDTNPLVGNNVYQVKVVRLEESASGSFYNQSLGVIDSIEFSPIVDLEVLPFETSFHLFPNPGSDKITVVFEDDLKKGGNLSLWNNRAQRIRTWKLKPGQTRLELEVSDLSKGIYFLNVGRAVQKLVLW